MKQLLSIAFALIGFHTMAAIIRVDIDAIGLNNGNTWANAYEDLQDALATAVSGDEIWVAEGIYKPTTTTDRTIRFVIPDGVELYGGFNGTETARSDRDWDLNATILSGAIGNANDNADNSYGIVYSSSNIGDPVLLDGFHIRKAYGNALVFQGLGPIHFVEAEATIRHCEIYENEGDDSSGLHVVSGNVTVDNCLFRDNNNYNAADWGTLISNSFPVDAVITIIETTIADNTFNNANAFLIGGCCLPSELNLYNSIIWSNENTTIESGMGTTVYNCIVEGGLYNWSGNDLLDEDPQFVDAAGNDFSCAFTSPARNAGDDSFTELGFDLNHNTRSVDGTVDMGCYENQLDGIIYVDDSATGLNDGTSWVDAFDDLQDALAIATDGFEIWVDDGTYKPTSALDRTIKFVIPEGVQLYGGFGGFETQRNQRDWDLFPAILSGAIGGVGETDNSRQIIYSSTSEGIVIDGFEIRKAYNELTTGGAITLSNGNPVIKHCNIHDNYALGGSGFIGGSSEPITFEECLFFDNTTDNDKVIRTGSTDSEFIFNNCTITRNETNGSEIFGGQSFRTFTFNNCILWNHDDLLFQTGSTINLYSCIVEDFVAGDVTDYANVISTSPKFTDAANNDFTIKLDSPAHNAGDNLLSTSNKDLAANERIYEDIVDIGCYENQTPSIYYVDLNATGLNNGTTWTDAYTDLHEALNNAIEGQQVWVADGTYFTSYANTRSESFVLKNNVPVYGGFAGGETSLDERDWFNNVTDLSGNIGSGFSTTDNAYHVLFANDATGSFLIDGFSIHGGHADGALTHEDIGGAALIEYSTGTFTMNNCFVFANFTDYTGGAVTTFANSVFLNTTFLSNESHIGGAIQWSEGTTIENCLFVDNIANVGIVTHNFGGLLDMRGCTFEGNTVNWEHYAIVDGGDGTIANTVIWGNTLFDSDEEAITLEGDIHHCILQGPEFVFAIGEEVYFENAQYTDAANFDYTLQPTSVGINAGDNSVVTQENDVAGNARILLGTVDMGALESNGAVAGVIYVDDNASGANDGTNWIDAYTNLQTALTASVVGDEIWVATGVYFPSMVNNRDTRFEMKDSLQIYGGFAGIETQRNQRNWFANKSQLSGEIGSEPNTDNSKRLLNFDNDQGVVVDGFVVRSAYDDPSLPASAGTAMLLTGGSTATIRHCEIYGNSGYRASGASISTNSIATFDNCLFHDNLINQGAVVDAVSASAQINLYSCTIAGNEMIASYATPVGGASDSQLDLYNTIIWGNDNIQEDIGPDTDLTNCLVEGFVGDLTDTLHTAVLTIDPQFVAPNVEDPDYSLSPGSIAIDFGSNAHSNLSNDLGHNTRIQNTTVDIGCYEGSGCSQPNDVCDNSVELLVDNAPVMGSTKCATGGDSPSNACAAVTGKTVWYSFDAPTSGEVNVNANHLLNVTANFNIRLALYSGVCSSLAYITCINATGNSGNEVLNASGLISGNTYYIRVDAASSQEGVFMIDVDEVVPDCPGDFDDNGTVNVADLLIFTSEFGCTSSCGEPDMDGNGAVNVGDLLIFTSVFGNVCP